MALFDLVIVLGGLLVTSYTTRFPTATRARRWRPAAATEDERAAISSWEPQERRSCSFWRLTH